MLSNPELILLHFKWAVRVSVFRTLLHAFLFAGGILALFIAVAAYRNGSIHAAIAYLAGDDIYISPKHVTVPGQGLDAKAVVFSNLSNRSIHIVGYNAVCSCITVSNLPLTLGPRARGEVEIHAVSKVSKAVPLIFISDDPGQTRMEIKINVVADKL